MTATGINAARSGPAFPIRAVAIGIVLLVSLAIGSAATSWIVGSRIRTIGSSQLSVLTATTRLKHESELLELLATATIETGDEAYARRYAEVQPELRRSLETLRSAIELRENRTTFKLVEQAERTIASIEYRALDLAVNNQVPAARALLRGRQYQDLVRAYRTGLEAIEARSRAYLDATRDETNRYLAMNFGASLSALLLIALAWLVLVQPARKWVKQLGVARRKAETATAAKSEFLAVMSHEVRTPLNSIIGFADLLLSEPRLKGSQRRQVELIQGAGAMLLTVVNDLLDFSKIEAGKIELAPGPFAVETLVDNAVSIVRPSAEAKGLEMRVEMDPGLSPYLLGDENRIRQVLLNLLNNAVKFTAHGFVMLNVAKTEEDGDRQRVRFTITDTGVGIPADRQQQLFEPFTQADASITRRFGGTGLGLSISRRLIELMGGEIGLQSKEGSGSSFWFAVDLPWTSSPVVSITGVGIGTAITGASILLAEDLPMNQELARAMLGRAGHKVDVVENGELAVKAVQEKAYDLVLMDIQMPRMDGVTATRMIRQLQGEAGKVPILAMTANVLPRQVMEFLAAGMNGHVAKPVRQRELEAAIATALPGWRTDTSGIGPESGDGGEEEAFNGATFRGVQQLLPAERLDKHVADLDGAALLLAAERNGDPEAIAAAAHKIVSQAGMLGLLRLSSSARELEDDCREGKSLDAAMGRFRIAATDVRTHVFPLLQSAPLADKV